MAGQEDDASKEFEPTPRKLELARQKGDIPRSTDANVAAAYLGLLIAMLASGSWMAVEFGTAMSAMLDRPEAFSDHTVDGGISVPMGRLITSVGWSVTPLFLVPAGCVILSLVAQNAITMSPTKLAFKASRISPLENAKNKFGFNGLFEFAKSSTKLAIFSVVLGAFLFAHGQDIVASMALQPVGVGSYLAGLSISFLFIVLAIAASIAAVDLIWQNAEHQRKNRMSRKEVQDEAKESEGDPYLKQQRRQRGQEIAARRMLSDIPGADVVVVNPSHYAVVLKWDRLQGSAPICVAKGVDQIAARIREIAIEAGVPIFRDPPTARAIFASVEIGEEIRPQDYRAVAAAIRFAEEMVRKSVWTSARN